MSLRAVTPSKGRRNARSRFIAVTAEEQGLLGSLYYSDHLIYPARDTVALINMDGESTSGPSRDIEVIGYGKSEMDDLITEAARAQGRRVAPDSDPQAGYFYRSDQLHLARLGVPVLYTANGIDLVEGGTARGRQMNEDYRANRYHNPADEILPTWDLRGAAQDAELYYNVGRGLADSDRWPRWRPDAEFRAAREASGRP